MKKKILLIGSELGKGGAERSISLLSYYLEKEYDVTLCILSGKERERYYKTCERVVFIDPPASSGYYGKVKAWYYRLSKLRALKKDNNIAVSISFLEGPDYANVLTAGKEKIVLSVRGSKVYDKMIAGKMGMIRKKILIPWLYKRAHEVVCVTNALSDEMRTHFGISPKRLRTIYNFYEIAEIRALAHEPLSAEEEKIFTKKVIISSGRLHIQKEHDKLIRLLSILREQEDVRLLILGDGELREDLKNLAGQRGLKVCDWKPDQRFTEADIYFMGFQANAFKFYKRSSLFALSSSWEGFPNVLAEALICELPVVTTDCYTGPREILSVEGLETVSVSEAIRTPVGSLLPLLTEPSAAVNDLWIDEIRHWLHTPAPTQQEFHKLTHNFSVGALIGQWKEVIENKTKASQ